MFDNEYQNQLHPYLDSICQEYAQWWEFYTLTDVVGKQRDKQKQGPPLLDLMVQTVEQQQEEREEGKEKIERLAVIEGLHKYAPNHVLLVGRPGSGKSTALVRLLLEEAERGRRGDGETGRWGIRIPVLVELRYYQHSVLERVKAFLLKHQPNLDVDEEILKQWLHQGRLLLLLDGFNELPSEEARQQVRVFRQDYPNTPMVFTTRDLGVGGDLNITKKLEMQPLTEAQMRRFVCAYLPQQGEQMLKQLGSRLREFGETPLLLWMLCSVFANNSHQIPANLGSVFRRFTEIYDYQLKQGVCTYRESRDWWQDLLQHLAWIMTQGKSKTELMVAIPRQEAKVKLTEFLRGKVASPDDDARRWLQDLLDYHLIQVDPGSNQIGFCHQLLLEYYTAENLLQQLASLSDQQLKWDYLNYLKWTEPLALMMELLEDQEQAVRVVKLALEVDWLLGARLAGEVKGKFQKETVGLVLGLPLPRLLKVELAGVTKSDKAIPELIKALEDSDVEVCRSAADALGKIGSDTAVPALINALEYSNSSNYHLRWNTVNALEKIGSDAAVPTLINALQYSDSDVRKRAAEALGEIGSDAAVPALINALQHSDSGVRKRAADALGKIGSDTAVSALINALEHSNSVVCWNAAEVLGKIGSDSTVPALINALQHSNFDVRQRVAEALGKIGSDAAVSVLINVLENSNDYVGYKAAEALGKIGSDAAVTALINALQHSNNSVYWRAVKALGEISSDAAVTALINALQHSNYKIGENAAEALGKIGSDAAVTALINTLKHSDPGVRKRAADALGKVGSNTAVSALINAVEYSDFYVRKRAAEVLGKIDSGAAITALINALEHSNYLVAWKAAEALGKIGSGTAITALINALEYSNSGVRKGVAEALGKIGSDAAVTALINALEHSNSSVRKRVAEALEKVSSDVAVTALINALEHSNSSVRKRVAEVLGKISSDAAVTALINALEHSNDYAGWKAANALGKIGSDAAVTALINVLEHSNDYAGWKAANALGKIGSDAAVTALINVLEHSNDYAGWKAANALGKIGSYTAIPQLIKKLQDNSFATANRGDTLNEFLNVLKTIQERCQYYRPTPKLTMPNSLSHNYTLLIGVGESAYPQWSLPVTVKDTLALKSLLTDPNLCGYVDDEQHLRLLNDAIATKESILSNLNWLQQQAAADSEATVLVYYSGHGWLDNATGKYYLIPHDVEPFDIPNSALPADTFTEVLQQIPAQRLLVIIDSCHAAGMATAKNGQTKLKLPGNFLPTALPKELIDKLKQGTGRAVFTSSTGEQQSWIRPDDTMSIYTFHFLEALQGAGNQPGDQVVTVSNLMNYLGKTVPDSAKQLCQAEQTPFFDFATEDFPVALLHGGKGMPQQGWDKVKAEAQERISQIGDISGDKNKVNVGDRNTKISIGTAGDIKIGDISS
ncbi:MAG: NACHT domain-containing protein [Symploca sp. SIO1B1]|nr:NACHT domain-containing protein [Symploca sp. SIO1B1]